MSTGQHPALITDYDRPPTLTLVLPAGLGKDEVLAGLAQAIGQARADLAIRARRFQQCVEEHAARGDQLRQALCRGQVLASGGAAAYIDEAIVAAFDLWPQYQAQLAAQTADPTHAQAAAASPGQEPPASPASVDDKLAAAAATIMHMPEAEVTAQLEKLEARLQARRVRPPKPGSPSPARQRDRAHSCELPIAGHGRGNIVDRGTSETS